MHFILRVDDHNVIMGMLIITSIMVIVMMAIIMTGVAVITVGITITMSTT